MHRLTALLVLFFGVTLAANAETYVWTGEGEADADGAYAWADPKNWGGVDYPHAAEDTAEFPATLKSDVTVKVAESYTLAGLVPKNANVWLMLVGTGETKPKISSVAAISFVNNTKIEFRDLDVTAYQVTQSGKNKQTIVLDNSVFEATYNNSSAFTYAQGGSGSFELKNGAALVAGGGSSARLRQFGADTAVFVHDGDSALCRLWARSHTMTITVSNATANVAQLVGVDGSFNGGFRIRPRGKGVLSVSSSQTGWLYLEYELPPAGYETAPFTVTGAASPAASSTISVDASKLTLPAAGETVMIPLMSAGTLSFADWESFAGSFAFTIPEGVEPDEIDAELVNQNNTLYLKLAYVPAGQVFYTVRFFGVGGELLSEQKVQEGHDAVAPAFTTPGFEFLGWDKDFTGVTADLDVQAQYQAIVPTDVTPDETAVTYTWKFNESGQWNAPGWWQPNTTPCCGFPYSTVATAIFPSSLIVPLEVDIPIAVTAKAVTVSSPYPVTLKGGGSLVMVDRTGGFGAINRGNSLIITNLTVTNGSITFGSSGDNNDSTTNLILDAVSYDAGSDADEAITHKQNVSNFRMALLNGAKVTRGGYRLFGGSSHIYVVNGDSGMQNLYFRDGTVNVNLDRATFSFSTLVYDNDTAGHGKWSLKMPAEGWSEAPLTARKSTLLKTNEVFKVDASACSVRGKFPLLKCGGTLALCGRLNVTKALSDQAQALKDLANNAQVTLPEGCTEKSFLIRKDTLYLRVGPPSGMMLLVR